MQRNIRWSSASLSWLSDGVFSDFRHLFKASQLVFSTVGNLTLLGMRGLKIVSKYHFQLCSRMSSSLSLPGDNDPSIIFRRVTPAQPVQISNMLLFGPYSMQYTPAIRESIWWFLSPSHQIEWKQISFFFAELIYKEVSEWEEWKRNGVIRGQPSPLGEWSWELREIRRWKGFICNIFFSHVCWSDNKTSCSFIRFRHPLSVHDWVMHKWFISKARETSGWTALIYLGFLVLLTS